ncbi:MAG: GH1 family beta-glucosidase [Bacillota bacterium]
MALYQFPKDFLWGAATASYQIEGAAFEDGRGESIWDRFCRTPGKVFQYDNGDIACDHYHRYKEDVALMANLGLQTYRFSIAWPRIFPTGSGAPNQKGVDFYRRLVEELQAKGIKPAATLYHWDLPQALEDQGGWRNRETAYRFEEYADYMFRALGDSVPMWITHNEPWCASFLSHALGHHAPGMTDWHAGFTTAHHLLLSHGLAVQAYRALGLKGQIGITLNLAPQYPATDSPEDAAAGWTSDAFTNRWFTDPVFKGYYPEDLVRIAGGLFRKEYLHEGDLELIGQKIDFLGVNYYSRGVIAHDPKGLFGYRQVSGPGPVTDMGWEVYPEGMTDLLLRLHKDYGGIDMYITENGSAYVDAIEGDRVDDPERLDYLRRHFAAAQKAIAQGVNLKGYYVWSLMDNFEWAFGYSKRFGIIYVDYETQRRIPKASALWYRQVIADGGKVEAE